MKCAEWISVKDEPPEIGKDFLVLLKNKVQVVAAHNQRCEYWNLITADGFVGEPLIGLVTHYRELPELPGENE